MRLRLRDESPDRYQWPRQHPGLLARQRRHHAAPPLETRRLLRPAMEKIVEPLRESPRPARRPHRIPQRHLLEREDHAMPRALLYPHRSRHNLPMLAVFQQPPKLFSMQRLLPALMRLHLMIPLPLEIGRIPESPREETEKLLPLPSLPPASSSLNRRNPTSGFPGRSGSESNLPNCRSIQLEHDCDQ